ncbi:restriction endonuclease subunit S [Acinetobacter pittii]|uniref:restriction endonuclease subunit S n=1 Tax=Acinetobacter pittii TaxID=48296 RepID=UPI000A32E9F4|nr:restriction endonuclease subunit S [Acinetobacter pittii]OTS53357.1 hypothetical protein CAT00_09430 [Acinetobacter pittii]
MVPNGWKIRTLSEILVRVSKQVNVQPDMKYQEIGIRSHGKGIFHKPLVKGDILGDKRVFHIEPNCFILNIVFAWEQAIAKTTDNEIGLIASHRFPMYRPIENLCNLDFILYYFKTAKGKDLLELASPGGAGRNKTLGQSDFLQLKIALPPIEEQNKIAEMLLTWDQAISITEKLLVQSQKQKKSFMQQLLTGEKRLFDENGIQFSGAWRRFSLKDLGSTFNGLTGKSKEDFGKGHAYIPYINIFKNNRIDIHGFDFVEVKEDENQNLVRYGDIFFTTSSETVEEVGMSSVLLDEVEGVYLNSFCFGYRLKDFHTLLPKFARYIFRSVNVRKRISLLGQGATRSNLSKSQLMNLELELPCLNEQEKIANVLSLADQEIEILQKKLDLLKQEKKALMQQLLTGKKRVKVAA